MGSDVAHRSTGTEESSRLSRRTFLAATAAVTAAGLAPLGITGALAASPAGPRALATLHLADFHRCIGQVFRARHGSGVTSLHLSAARPSGYGAAGHECFTLEFRRAHGAPLAQGTYRLSNRTLGRFELFLVPNGDSAKRLYTAVINRARPA